MTGTIHLGDDAEAVARAAAEAWVAAANQDRDRARFRVGVSGGTTPRRLYELVSGSGFAPRFETARLEVLFADERGVPSDHPDSNYAMVRATLLEPLGISSEQVHRMRGEAPDLDAAAREYDSRLETPLDLLVLGIGEDGHTASLFPGSRALEERVRRVVAIGDSPKPPPRRITITPRVLDEARRVWVLATGDSKSRAVSLALEGTPGAVPASLARRGDWYLDRAAARELMASKNARES